MAKNTVTTDPLIPPGVAPEGGVEERAIVLSTGNLTPHRVNFTRHRGKIDNSLVKFAKKNRICNDYKM